MERLGVGPDVVLKRNPKIVYGRMTGWGQTGPYANAAGHDMNYIAISGALHAIGLGDKPIPPLNLVGDFGGGALYLAFGLMAGVICARATGQGQVIDCAMSDGAASLMAMFYGFKASGMWTDNRRENMLDGGAHFYDTYQCSDGRWILIGSIEPQFYALLLEKTGITDPAFQQQMNRAEWPALRAKLAEVIKTRVQGRVVRDHGRHRRLLRPGAGPDRDRRPPAQRRAAEPLSRSRSVVQPAPRAAFSGNAGGDPVCLTADRRPQRRGLHRLGLLRRRGRGAQSRRRALTRVGTRLILIGAHPREGGDPQGHQTRSLRCLR